jgi:hypothetical protein
MAECRSCPAKVIWVRTKATDKKPAATMPLDAAEGSDDTVRPQTFPDGNIKPTGRYVPGRFGKVMEVEYVAPGPDQYRSHFASCPGASAHRRPR